MDIWKTYRSARQIADELKKFLGYAENSQQSTNLQVRYHGVALSDIAIVLQQLKQQLFHDSRYMQEFCSDFINAPNNGVDLLLRTLAVVQQQLFEAQQQGRIASILQRNSSNKRRKAGIAEADCLECLKLLIAKTACWRKIMEHVANLETILISLSSPQLDSKCYALELVTSVLDYPDGFLILYKALTACAGKKRDDSRLSIITAQLRHGLSTNKLHIQILIMKLLNQLIAAAPTLNYRIIIQAEAETAGFNPEQLEKTMREYKSSEGMDALVHELNTWRHTYLPLVWLEKRTLDMPPLQANHTMYAAQKPSDSLRTNQSSASDATLKQQGKPARMYDVSPKITNAQAPVARGFERLRRRRESPILEEAPVATVRTSILRQSATAPDKQPGAFVTAENSGPEASAIFFNDQYAPLSVAAGTVAPEAHHEGRQAGQSHHREAIPYAKSASMPFLDEGKAERRDTQTTNRPQSSRTGQRLTSDAGLRHQGRSQSMHQLNELAGRQGREREHVIPVRLENGDMRRHGKQYQSTEHLVFTEPSRKPSDGPSAAPRRTKSIDEQASGGSPSFEFLSSAKQTTPGEMDRADIRRTRSDAADKIHMQGFSYLFPAHPLVQNVPRRTPSPTLPSDHRYAPAERSQYVPRPTSVPPYSEHKWQSSERSPPRAELSSARTSEIFERARTPSPPVRQQDRDSRLINTQQTKSGSNDPAHVIYIPIRMENAPLSSDPAWARKPAATSVPHLHPAQESAGVATHPSRRPNAQAAHQPQYVQQDPQRQGMMRHRYVPADTAHYYHTSDRRGGGGVLHMRGDSDSAYEQRSSSSRRSMGTGSKGSISQDDVDDALRNFDYLNDYSVDESSYASNRYGVDR